MPVQEISTERWEDFWKRFQEMHQDQEMTITTINDRGEQEIVARERPLRAVRFSHGTGGCSDTLSLIVEDPKRRRFSHEIVSPLRVRMRYDGDDSKALEILGETGLTFIVFRSGRIETLLENMDREPAY